MGTVVPDGSTILCSCTRVRVAVHRVLAPPAPQLGPASRLRSATRDISFLRSDSRYRRYVSDLPNVTPRFLGSEQKGWVSLLYLILSSRLASLLLRRKDCDTVFVVLSFSFQVWRYSPTVAMYFVSTPSTACQSPSTCMIARSSAYAYFLERWLAGQPSGVAIPEILGVQKIGGRPKCLIFGE